VIKVSYTALYRKFRPPVFEQIVGQEHITKTLKNQIMAGRVGHAYLFNGGRGTGKTSAAKVLARAVNCLNPQDGEPCNECEICKAALAGSLTDIVEMDAASNNSVEDIRSIRDEVNFLPTVARYRVYIIDEVHMLSTGAFNALLKTLEEPPEHVKFILATTEPQKIPATILSRCQRFDFKKIPDQVIAKRLEFVCNESNIEASQEALITIASLSEGAMRDALSILDRCLQDGSDEISVQKIKDLVGIPQTEYISNVIRQVLESNIEECMKQIDILLNDGKDLNNILWEMIKYVKDILVYKTSKQVKLYTQDEINKIKELSEVASKERLFDVIFKLSDLENQIKWSNQKSILFQIGIMKLCGKQEAQDMNELNLRIDGLEKKLQNLQSGVIHTKVQNVDNSAIKSNNTVKKNEKINSQIQNRNVVTGTPGKKIDSWPNIVKQLKQDGKIMLYTNLMNTNAKEINDMTVGIEFPKGLTSFGKTILEKPENMNELTKLISIQCGKEMRVKLIEDNVNNVQRSPQDEFTNEVTSAIDMPINIMDE
jgi:DNA polymerase-3 subunit gamma/tau